MKEFLTRQLEYNIKEIKETTNKSPRGSHNNSKPLNKSEIFHSLLQPELSGVYFIVFP